ncbi:MAG: hypothetical protein ACI915_000402 [Gammaproteobacteria bacterium]|jgi:hypothetical protein
MNMNKRTKSLISGAATIGAILMLSSTPALAGGQHGYDNGHHNRGQHYDRSSNRSNHYDRRHNYKRGYKRNHAYRGQGNGRYYSDNRFRYNNRIPVQVIYHAPVYRQPVQSYYSTSRGYQTNRINGGNLVGGALGGYLGSTIGRGPGRLAATAAGAVIGYTLGGHVAAQY